MRAPSLFAALAFFFFAADARAVRPFVTDDARVVGKGHIQLETWWRRDRGGLQHWAVAAVGPNDRTELSFGFVHGMAKPADAKPAYSIAGPLIQGKFLVHEALPNSWPGLAAIFGAVAPGGTGGFVSPGWTLFSYLSFTESLFREDGLLIHANVGFAGSSVTNSRFSWGIGTEFHVYDPLHLVAEIYSGDPYIAGASGTTQFGARFYFSDHLQLDLTGGVGLFADKREDVTPPFVGTGLRIVSHSLW